MIKLAVIGDPIEHSLSPAVHGAVLDNLGVDYQYYKVQVKKGELEAFLRFVREKEIDGFNLTMPHKVDILPYLSEIEEEAARFQSVNTVRVRNGNLYGYNTDAGGYTTALSLVQEAFSQRSVVILGAGGVARTILYKAALDGASALTVLNRTLSQATAICDSVKEKTGVSAQAFSMDAENLYSVCRSCDILINATPLGMHGMTDDFSDFGFLDVLPDTCLVSDLIYNPEQTRLLYEAECRGHRTLNGLGMLIFQAMLADEIYLDTSMDKLALYPAVSRAVKKVIL